MHVEEVQLHGHILDSLLLPKVLDTILSRGGSYHIKDLRLGNRQTDASNCVLEVRAQSAEQLEEILGIIHDHGAVPTHPADCQVTPADLPGCFPDGFYCSTNYRTQVRRAGEWVEVEGVEMDCGIRVDAATGEARCVPMTATPAWATRVVTGQRRRARFPARNPETDRSFRVHVQRGFEREAQGRDRARGRRRHEAAPRQAGAKDPGGPRPRGRPHRRQRLGRQWMIQRRLPRHPFRRQRPGHARHGTILLRHQSLGVSLDQRRARRRGSRTPLADHQHASAGHRLHPPRRSTPGMLHDGHHVRLRQGGASPSCWPAASATTARCRTSSPT